MKFCNTLQETTKQEQQLVFIYVCMHIYIYMILRVEKEAITFLSWRVGCFQESVARRGCRAEREGNTVQLFEF